MGGSKRGWNLKRSPTRVTGEELKFAGGWKQHRGIGNKEGFWARVEEE